MHTINLQLPDTWQSLSLTSNFASCSVFVLNKEMVCNLLICCYIRRKKAEWLPSLLWHVWVVSRPHSCHGQSNKQKKYHPIENKFSLCDTSFPCDPLGVLTYKTQWNKMKYQYSWKSIGYEVVTKWRIFQIIANVVQKFQNVVQNVVQKFCRLKIYCYLCINKTKHNKTKYYGKY